LDYIKNEKDMKLYDSMEYHLIEASGVLHNYQKEMLGSLDHYKQGKVTCYHKSILDDWDAIEPRPCFVIGMELLDNLPQDKISFDIKPDGTIPMQGVVLTNENARFSMAQPVFVEAYEPVSDLWVQKTLEIMDKIGYKHPSLQYLLNRNLPWNFIRQEFFSFMHKFLPEWQDSLASEFIPTMIVKLLHKLLHFFPKHELLLSDFSELPNTIPGHAFSPVVQTNCSGQTIPCSTYLLRRGLFDIFFPIPFPLVESIYRQILYDSKFDPRKVAIQGHVEFMHRYASLENTRLRNGYNPLLQEFKNVKMMLTS
jgi:hypothetical protein